MIRVGVCGYATSGKDVAATALVRERGFVRVNMSDAVLRDLQILDPLVETDGAPMRLSTILAAHTFDEAKSLFPDFRRMLQVYGTDVWRTIDANTWVLRAQREAYKHERVVTTGIRFPNEMIGIDVLVSVHRPGVGPVNDHVSDAGIGAVMEMAHEHLTNDGSVDDLRRSMLSVIDRYL